MDLVTNLPTHFIPYTYIHIIYILTLQLLDRIGPAGRFGENPISSYYLTYLFFFRKNLTRNLRKDDFIGVYTISGIVINSKLLI